MDNNLSRNIGAISEEEQSRLARSHVFVAGCGGLGGYAVELLARIGVGAITTADSGCFQESDLNRQILATTASMERRKVLVASERARLINPGIVFTAIDASMDSQNLPGFIDGCDIAIDALDNKSTRKALFEACQKKGIPIVHGAIQGWQGQAAFALLPSTNLYSLLYQDSEGSSPKEPVSVLSFTASYVASIQVSLAARHLCGRRVGEKLYTFDLLEMGIEAYSL
ncbi:MAG: HesA/MoeB/ThiF family protein [Eubacteriaceae bacterium]|nr:HesA/MoeB/ThiF family protein [Eubacteriaceae bacterium]